MRTFELPQLPTRNSATGNIMNQQHIFVTRWKIFQSIYAFDHILFYPNHELTVTDHGNESVGQWYQQQDEFTLVIHGHEYHYILLFADPNLLVFQDPDTKKCLILTATSTQRQLHLNTIDGVEQYMFGGSKSSSVLPIGLYALTGLDTNDQEMKDTETYADDPDDTDDTDEYTDDDEFSEYADLTKEEIIYDYLQRQEEEQDEEDYYLQEMQDDE